MSVKVTIFALLLPVFSVCQGTSLLKAVETLLRESDRQMSLQLSNPSPLQKEYDFIVIGGGSAGCVVASRLSENPQWKVLLLEAGGSEELLTDIPILVGTLPDTKLDWKYEMERDPRYCRGYRTGGCPLVKAKVLGGNSVFNYMVVARGNKKDYDGWAAMGNPGWTYEEVLPYFKKLENMTDPVLRNSPYHGTEGPINVKETKFHSSLAKTFLEAGRELGYKVADYNGAQQTVFSYFQFNQSPKGRRQSTAASYLFPVIQQRRNIQVVTNAFVRKTLINNQKAYGVEIEYGGKLFRVRARREVIVSAGGINSPQLLMLSGIGPKDHLAKIGIPVKVDLPVGLNFHDHVSFGSVTFVTNATEKALLPDLVANDPKYLLDYVNKGYGPYELPGGNEAVFFLDTTAPKDPNGFPDMEVHFLTATPWPISSLTKLKPEFKNLFDSVKNKPSFSITLRLMQPKSVGFMQLRSADPHAPPKIFPHYFTNPADVQISLIGIRKALEISRTRAFQKFGTRLNNVAVPGCESSKFNSDAYWICVMRTWTQANFHESGTCTMSPEGVVDERLRVHGVEGLRVVDASIFPKIPSCHNNIPTIMTAEKGSDMIKEDNLNKG